MPLDLERRFPGLQTMHEGCLVGSVRLAYGHKEQAVKDWFLSHIIGRKVSAIGQSMKARTDLKSTKIGMGRG